MDAIETIKLAGNHKGKIFHDTDTECPYDPRHDSEVKIVILHRRYVDPAKGTCGTDPDSVQEWVEANEDEWHILPLWMYDHGGTALAVGEGNPFSCQWDSGRVGIAAIKKSEHITDPKAAIDGWVQEYSMWSNGECYGYTIEDEDGDEVDSCWGFIGIDHVRDSVNEFTINN